MQKIRGPAKNKRVPLSDFRNFAIFSFVNLCVSLIVFYLFIFT
nr:MAG TPA: Jumping translocation breakpoint protein (JTB) [Inoviridae sp.]